MKEILREMSERETLIKGKLKRNLEQKFLINDWDRPKLNLIYSGGGRAGPLSLPRAWVDRTRLSKDSLCSIEMSEQTLIAEKRREIFGKNLGRKA